VEFLKLLTAQYSYAVDQAAIATDDVDGMRNPFGRLAEHIVLLYGRGDFGAKLDEALKTNDGLLRRLLLESSERLRTYAMTFIGRTLQNHDNKIEPDVLQRFMDLWDWYWQEIGREDAQKNPSSSAFGYWFSSGAFKVDWALDRLHQFVTAAP